MMQKEWLPECNPGCLLDSYGPLAPLDLMDAIGFEGIKWSCHAGIHKN